MTAGRPRHRPSRRRSGLAPALAATLVVLAGCSSTPEPSGGQGRSGVASPPTVTVFAAASLKTSFTRLAHDFEATHPGTHVALTFGGSADLVGQLTAGAPADVLATADETNMTKAMDAGVVAPGAPAPFATNVLTVVTPPTNPAHIASFTDLAAPEVQTVVCAPQVPCGRATARLEQLTNTRLTPVSEENAVTDVLGKVTSGQADAGVVYVTDATAAGPAVHRVPVPQANSVVNTYPIAVTIRPASPAAGEFVAYVRGAAGRKVLAADGFGAPS